MATADAPLDVNLLLVEDHAALSKGLELLLRGIGCHVVGTAESVERGLELFRRRSPDIVIVDYALGDGLGTELVTRIRATDPAAKVIVYTGTTDAAVHATIVASGASGLALKGSDLSTIFDAVRVVAGGGRYVDPKVRVAPANGRILTRRQSEILALLADGLTGEETADRLVLSPETIRTHIRNAMDRLGAHTRVHAVSLATHQQELAL